MEAVNLNQIRLAFGEYVQGFVHDDPQLHQCYQVKVDHTQRVAREMRELATSLNWSASEIHIAEAVGWLHDIGRFSQFQEFGSFNDFDTIDHGQRGCEVLKSWQPLAALTEKERQVILAAVRHHNGKCIPDHLQGRALAQTRLIRDADKLDIFQIVSDELKKDGFQALPRMLPQVDMNAPINPELIAIIKRDRVCSYSMIRSLGDCLLLQMAWIYNINYAPTFRVIQQRSIIENINAHLPTDNSELNDLIQEIQTYVQTHA